MIIDRLNTILGSNKDLHVIYYTTDISVIPTTVKPLLDDIAITISYDFVYDYVAKKLYRNNGGLVLVDGVDDLLSFDITDQTIGRSEPTDYMGIDVNGVMDSGWPPNIKTGHMYVSNNFNLIYALKYIKKGEFAIIGDNTYLLIMYPANIPSYWLKLKNRNTYPGAWWNKETASIDASGTMELGKVLDFHCIKTAIDDYTYRLTNSTEGLLLTSGTLTIGDNLNVTHDTTLNGALNVNGSTTLDALHVNGSTTLDALHVTNDTTLNGPVIINSNLTVSDPVTLNNTCNILNTLSTKDIFIDGELSVTNDTNVSGNLFVTLGGTFKNVQILESLSVVKDIDALNIMVTTEIKTLGKFVGNGSEITDIVGESIATGTISYDRLPIGNDINTVADGIHNHNELYQKVNDWMLINYDYTALNGDRILVNTTDSDITISLPLNPVLGFRVLIKDLMGTFNINPVTINRNGSNILGNTNNVSISVADSKIELLYTNATRGWIVL